MGFSFFNTFRQLGKRVRTKQKITALVISSASIFEYKPGPYFIPRKMTRAWITSRLHGRIGKEARTRPLCFRWYYPWWGDRFIPLLLWRK